MEDMIKYEKKKTRYNDAEASAVKAVIEEAVKELDRLNKIYSHDFSLETEKTFNSYVPCSS